MEVFLPALLTENYDRPINQPNFIFAKYQNTFIYAMLFLLAYFIINVDIYVYIKTSVHRRLPCLRQAGNLYASEASWDPVLSNHRPSKLLKW